MTGAAAARLGRWSLPALARAGVAVVPPVEGGGPCGVVHLGAGAFARGHVLALTAAAVAAEPGPWRVCAVAQRSADVVGALAAQDGLYTVLEKDGAGARPVVVDVVAATLVAAREPERLDGYLADPACAVVTVTGTEAAYRPAADGSVGAVAAQLARAARGRWQADAGPLTVVACDNVMGGGPLLRTLVLDALRRLPGTEPAAVERWTTENVRFCSSVVDRIVPRTSAADLDEVEGLLGVRDEAAVLTEPSARWVVEDAAGVTPAWERAGALRVADVRPWELAKLRLLNASHSLLAYAGLALGHRTTAGAVTDDRLAPVVRAFLETEMAPTVPPAEGLDLAAEVEASLRRCANPGLAHPLAQIAADGSAKLRERVAGPALEAVRAGRTPVWTALLVASWVLHLRTGPVVDAHAVPLRAAAALPDPGEAVAAVLAAAPVVDPELATSALFLGTTAEWLRRLTVDGAAATLRRP